MGEVFLLEGNFKELFGKQFDRFDQLPSDDFASVSKGVYPQGKVSMVA